VPPRSAGSCAFLVCPWCPRSGRIGEGFSFPLAVPEKSHNLNTMDHRDPNNTYAVREDENGKLVYLEDEIMNPAPDEFVVHLNGDTLDNRRSNLRVVKQSNPELS
jgi:hypothetical protein